MKRWSVLAVILAVAASTSTAQQSAAPPAHVATPPLKLTLPGFADGGRIPNRYTCVAGPAVVSPEIHWDHSPQGTQSFVLLFHDLEPRPANGLMDNSHWLLWNIPGTSTGLPEGIPAGTTLPDGTHQMKRPRTIPGSFFSYYGPCAPQGPDHHYVIELYALGTKLNLPDDASRADIMKAADGHILAASAWFGLFHKE
jgi:Raf kinase inhibitor-like YbhB/YbcL family protein